MKLLFVMLLLLPVNVLADSWWDQEQNRIAIQNATNAQVQATNEASRRQVEAMAQQTQAMQTASLMAQIQAQRNEAISLATQAAAASCKPVKLVDEETKQPYYMVTPKGVKIGPLYTMECP